MPAENVELIIRVKAEGQAVLDALKSAMGGLGNQVRTSGSILAQFDKTSDGVAITLRKVKDATDQATASQNRHAEGMTTSVLKANLLTEGVLRLLNAVKAATVESALYASRTEQMAVVMDQLSRVNRLDVDSVRAQAKAIQDLGITTQESIGTINQMIFAQLDLAKATDLARLAQNAAKIAGISSSEALAGIINGIVTQQIRVLRTYGIQVSFEQALNRGAAQLGKNVEILTDYERTNINLNEVLAKGPRILGTYEVSLTTVAGRMQSLTRHVLEARNAVGEQFVPALTRVIEFLTISSKHVKANAEAYADLSTHITAAGLAAAAFRFTPGGPVPKGIVAGAVFLGTELLGKSDPEKVAIESAQIALEQVNENRKNLLMRSQKGLIKSKEEYLNEVQRLADIEVIIQEQTAEKLAKIYDLRIKKREGSNKTPAGFGIFQQGPGGGVPDLPNLIPESIDLAPSIKITRDQIEKARAELGKFQTDLKEGLKFIPDPQSGIDAQFAQFRQRLIDVSKTTTANLERARSGLLSEESRIAQERNAEFRRVAQEFAPFDKSLKQGKEFQAILSNIAKTYELILEKEKRTQQVEEIRRTRQFRDAEQQSQIDRLRIQSDRAEKISKAELGPGVGIGVERQQIESVYQRRVELAQEEAGVARKRNQEDVVSADQTYRLTKDRKTLQDALLAFAITNLKIEGQVRKEVDEAELERTLALLELRKKGRDFDVQAAENRHRILEAEREVELQRYQGNVEREIRLTQARSRPGQEIITQDRVLQIRLDSAKREFEVSKTRIAADVANAYELYSKTRDREKLEKTIADLRAAEIKNAGRLEETIANARLDREISIMELRRKQTEELRQSLGSLFDALQAKGGFSGIKDFLDGYFKQIQKTIFVNVGEILLGGSKGKLGDIIPGQTRRNPQTGETELTILGRILRGTPLGVDPVKMAQEREIGSRDRNTKEIERLNRNLEKIQGQAGAGVTAGFGGIFGLPGGSGGPGVFGQGSNSPFIFSGFPRQGGPVMVDPITGQVVSGSDRGGLGGIFSRIGGGGGSLGVPFDPGKGTSAQFFDNIKNNPAAAAAVIALGAAGVYAGIQEGGKRGALTGISAATGTAAALDPEPISKGILMAISIGTGLARMLLGDPRKERSEFLDRVLRDQAFELPTAINRIQDFNGSEVDFNFRGGARAFPGAPPITVNINALDARSFQERGPEFAEVIQSMVQVGHPLRSTIGEIAGVM